jgi:hypothetical protein
LQQQASKIRSFWSLLRCSSKQASFGAGEAPKLAALQHQASFGAKEAPEPEKLAVLQQQASSGASGACYVACLFKQNKHKQKRKSKHLT